MKNKKKKFSLSLSELGMMVTCLLMYLQIIKVISPSIILTLTPMFVAYTLQYILIWVQFIKWNKMRKKREEKRR